MLVNLEINNKIVTVTEEFSKVFTSTLLKYEVLDIVKDIITVKSTKDIPKVDEQNTLIINVGKDVIYIEVLSNIVVITGYVANLYSREGETDYTEELSKFMCNLEVVGDYTKEMENLLSLENIGIVPDFYINMSEYTIGIKKDNKLFKIATMNADGDIIGSLTDDQYYALYKILD